MMADGIDQLQMMIKVMETIINPVNQTLARHTEAVQVMGNLAQRLVELYSQEPTRNTIIKEMREEIQRIYDKYQSSIDEHDDCCKDRNKVLNEEASRRVEEIIRRASDLVDTIIEDHHTKMNAMMKEAEAKTQAALSPVDKMNKHFEKLLLGMAIMYAVAGTAFVYIHSAVSKFEILQKGVESLTEIVKNIPKG